MIELRNEFPVRVAGGGVVVTCGKLSGDINELSFQARDDLCLRCVDIVGAPRPVSLRALSPSAWESFFFLQWLIRWAVGCLVPWTGVAGCLIVDGADVINAPRASPLLNSNRGSPGSTQGTIDRRGAAVIRVGRRLPEVTDLQLLPVLAGVAVTGVRSGESANHRHNRMPGADFAESAARP